MEKSITECRSQYGEFGDPGNREAANNQDTRGQYQQKDPVGIDLCSHTGISGSKNKNSILKSLKNLVVR